MIEEGQNHQGDDQVHQLVPPADHQGEVAHRPGGQGLGHLKLVGQVVGDAADDIAEHDTHQGDHDHILELDALDEPDEDPGAQDGEHKGEDGPAPQGGVGLKQQGQKNPHLGRGDGGAGGGGDELVHAQLLHDQARHAHANAGAQDGQQPGQAGDQEDLQLLQIAGQEPGQVDVDDPQEQGPDRTHQQGRGQEQGRQMLFDGRALLSILVSFS